jgi:hypothetical protein
LFQRGGGKIDDDDDDDDREDQMVEVLPPSRSHAECRQPQAQEGDIRSWRWQCNSCRCSGAWPLRRRRWAWTLCKPSCSKRRRKQWSRCRGRCSPLPGRSMIWPVRAALSECCASGPWDDGLDGPKWDGGPWRDERHALLARAGAARRSISSSLAAAGHGTHAHADARNGSNDEGSLRIAHFDSTNSNRKAQKGRPPQILPF